MPALNNAAKAVPGLVAELNRDSFKVDTNDSDEDIDLGRWVKTVDGRLVNRHAPEGQLLREEDILQGDKVLFAMPDLTKCDYIHDMQLRSESSSDML